MTVAACAPLENGRWKVGDRVQDADGNEFTVASLGVTSHVISGDCGTRYPGVNCSDYTLAPQDGANMAKKKTTTKKTTKKKSPAKKPPAKGSASKNKPPAKWQKSVPCKCAKLSVGADTARIGIKLERANFTSNDAEKFLIHSRCSVRLEWIADAADAQPDLMDVSPDPVEFIADIKSYSANARAFSTGLTLVLAEIDLDKITPFCGHAAKLSLRRTGSIPSDSDDGDDD